MGLMVELATWSEIVEHIESGADAVLETSILLAIAADRVDMAHAIPWDARELHPPFDPNNPNSPGYSPSGVYGDPPLATADKGRTLLAAMLADTLAVL